MIKTSFLEAQSAKSAAQNKTTPFLRRLVASVVDRAAHEQYGAAYAMKCLQTSHAVLLLLDRLNIGGVLCEGALCAALVHEDSRADGWGGFWGANHHVWAMTQFGEIVDLSISQMHRHSRSDRTDGIPCPPMWWDDKAFALPVIRHLPDNFFKTIAFSDETGAPDLAAFESRVRRIYEETLAGETVEQIAFGPLLENIDGARSLHRQGHKWLSRAIAFQERKIPLPRWVSEREAEMVAAAKSGAAPASMLRRSGRAPTEG